LFTAKVCQLVVQKETQWSVFGGRR